MQLILGIRTDSEYYETTAKYMQKLGVPLIAIVSGCPQDGCDIAHFDGVVAEIPIGLTYALDELIPKHDYFVIFRESHKATWQGEAHFDITLSFSIINYKEL